MTVRCSVSAGTTVWSCRRIARVQLACGHGFCARCFEWLEFPESYRGRCKACGDVLPEGSVR